MRVSSNRRTPRLRTLVLALLAATLLVNVRLHRRHGRAAVAPSPLPREFSRETTPGGAPVAPFHYGSRVTWPAGSTAAGTAGLAVPAATEGDVAFDGEVTLIAVMSMQRTASTYLAHKLLANYGEHFGEMLTPTSTCPHHHFISLNEVFQVFEKQSKKTWQEGLGRELLLSRGAAVADKQAVIRSLPARDLAAVVRGEARKRCRDHIQWDADRVRDGAYPFNFTAGAGLLDGSCTRGNTTDARHHCFVNYKHFENQLDKTQIPGLWAALAPDLVVVLERGVEARWRSTTVAEQTRDWNVRGGAAHKARVAAARVPPVSRGFRDRHENWYGLLRGLLSGSGRDLPHPPFVEVTYEEVVGDALGTRKKIFDALMAVAPRPSGR